MKSKGFIQIPILVAIIMSIIVVAGTTYFGVKKYYKTEDNLPKDIKADTSVELKKLRQEINELKNQKVSSQTTPKPLTVTELKSQNPQQYKSLITENKAQLLEASKSLSNKSIIARIKPSVVYIETSSGSGSGIVISTDGYILTNAHVVTSKNSATIKLASGESYRGTVVGRDENIDLAMLKINTAGLSAALLGDSNAIEQGDPVFTFGYPLGIEGDVAFKDGTLSRRQKLDGITYLEISAQILPGNSGGPLVNQNGEVIGVNTMTFGATLGGVSLGETLKYALPINIAKNLIPELKNGRSVIDPKYVKPTPAPAPFLVPTPLPPPQYVPQQPTPSPEPIAQPTFEFTPQVTIQPGAYGTGYGKVEITISESFEQCVWGITPDWGGTFNRDMSIDDGILYLGNKILSEQRMGDYKYEISCYGVGYSINKKTGSFKITEALPPPPPPPKITTQLRMKPWADAPDVLGEFKFYSTRFYYNSKGNLITSGGSLVDGSVIIKLKMQVTLTDNATSTNQLIFYTSSKNSIWQTFFNVKNGDILEINPLPAANTSLAWSFSDNPDYFTLKITGGTAVKDGKEIQFEF